MYPEHPKYQDDRQERTIDNQREESHDREEVVASCLQQTDVRSSLEHFSSTPVKSLPGKREDTPPASITTLVPLNNLANLPSSNLSSTPLSLASASKLLTPADNKSLIRSVR